jgi:hypothetical protein
LSEGILDGGNGEISLGGSRLNRFLKDVESVTATMGAGEAISPAEEARGVDDGASGPLVGAVNADPVAGADEMAVSPAGEMGQVLRDAPPDPWQVLLQMGAQFVGALAASNGSGPAAHSWIERDPHTGTQNLKLPLPSPEMARQLADVLSAVAEKLRGR